MDSQIHMDWCRGRSTISNEAWRTIEEKGVSSVLESKVSVSAEWSIRIGRTWEEVFEVLRTWDDKLSESS